ncbi:hypothetical protein BDY24DRAFT_414954 [Mrakia frigida]|uniref:uncharacterized protein n=1 Tax=Mrakia frigida TaxID=29902 RepID=UPI003FCBF968
MSRLVIYSFTPTGSSLSQKCYGWNQDTREKTIGYLKQTNKFPSLASVEDTSTLVFSVNDVEVPDEIDVWKAVLFAHRATPDFTISFKVRSEKELVVNGEKEKRALGLHFEARIWLTITYWLPSFLKHIHAAFHFLPQDSQPSRPTPPVDVTARIHPDSRIAALLGSLLDLAPDSTLVPSLSPLPPPAAVSAGEGRKILQRPPS